MGDPLILKEKENGYTSTGETSQKRRPLRNLTMSELRSLKKEVRTKIERNDAALSKLDQGFEDLKVCVLRMVNVIEECQSLVKSEKQECKELQHLLRDTVCSRTCKTNIVNPMVAGIPLKKARISLKRLGPMPQTQGYGRASTSGTASGSRSTQTSSNRAGQQDDEEMNAASDADSSQNELSRDRSRL